MLLSPKSVTKISRTKLCIACLLAMLGMMISLSILFRAPEAAAQGNDDSSRDLLTIKKSGFSHAAGAAEAAREIQAKMTIEAAREQVIDLIGEKRYLKSKSVVESKIVKQASRFIPYVNPGTPVQVDDGWKMGVDVQISPSTMRRMILEAGLLSDAEGPANILALVAIVDRSKGLSVRSWQDDAKDSARRPLATISQIFTDKAGAAFGKEGFHVVKPAGVLRVPEANRGDRLSGTDLKVFADTYKTQMILKGEIRTIESKNIPGGFYCALGLQVVQIPTGRTVTEVTRSFTTEAGAFESVVTQKLNTELADIMKELANQVVDSWQRGTLNTTTLPLLVRGSLSPRQVAELKIQLLQNVHEIKFIKERLFENGQTRFEIESTVPLAALAPKLRGLKPNGFDLNLVDARSGAAANELILEARSK